MLKYGYIYKEIKQLNPWKAAQNSDIPVKVPKEITDVFSAYICDFVNKTARKGNFLLILKHTLLLYLKKVSGDLKETIVLMVFYQLFRKCSKK